MVLPLLTFLGSLPWSWNATPAPPTGTVAVLGALVVQLPSDLVKFNIGSTSSVSALVVRSQMGHGGSSLEVVVFVIFVFELDTVVRGPLGVLYVYLCNCVFVYVFLYCSWV